MQIWGAETINKNRTPLDGPQLKKLYQTMEKEGRNKDDIIKEINSIYDITDYDVLLFLAYAFASYKTKLSRELLNHYGVLRPDRFEGWDTPVDKDFDHQIRYHTMFDPKDLPSYVMELDRRHLPEDCLVSIYLPSYNELEYTRLCVESLYKYSAGIHYDLILKDNGSTDGVLDYFNRLPQKKAVARGERTGPDDTKCVHEPYPNSDQVFRGRYTVALTADVILTPNWLKNLLICAAYNFDAAYICPTSNYPGVPLKQSLKNPPHDTYAEMLSFATSNNISEPNRWEKHFSLIDFICLMPSDTKSAYGEPDAAFIYIAMVDYDRCLRIAKANKTVICAKDCYCHHFGGVSMTNSGMITRPKLQTSIQILKEKHQGYDFERIIRSDAISSMSLLFDDEIADKSAVDMLSLDDAQCEYLMRLENHLRALGVENITKYSHTSFDSDISAMRLSVANVTCGGITHLRAFYEAESMDYVITGEYINHYQDVSAALKAIMKILKPGGCTYILWRNAYNYNNLRDKIENPDNMYVLEPVIVETQAEFEQKILNAGGYILAKKEEMIPTVSLGPRRKAYEKLEAAIGTQNAARLRLNVAGMVYKVQNQCSP